jgi:hypothetical protein
LAKRSIVIVGLSMALMMAVAFMFWYIGPAGCGVYCVLSQGHQQLQGVAFAVLGVGVFASLVSLTRLMGRDRSVAMASSLVITLILNTLAGILTLGAANGTTIVETNPVSETFLRLLGPGVFAVHIVELTSLYSIAILISKAISSEKPIFSSKKIYLFAFSLFIAVFPVSALADVLNDVSVIFWTANGLVGPAQFAMVALLCAVPFAALQASRNWTLKNDQTMR